MAPLLNAAWESGIGTNSAKLQVQTSRVQGTPRDMALVAPGIWYVFTSVAMGDEGDEERPAVASS